MRKINGTYFRGSTPVDFNFEVPSSWEELCAHQYATIVQVLSYQKADPYTISVSLLLLLCGSKAYNAIHNLDAEQKHALIPATNFLLETTPPVKNFFPLIKIRKKKHYAPAEDLSNLSFGEFCFAFEVYDHYLKTKDSNALNQLIAILYREPKTNKSLQESSGDIRETFNENLINKSTLSVAHIEERFKLAILAWFTTALNFQLSLRPKTFPPSLGDATEQEKSEKTFFTIFRALQGPKWGTSETLKNTNAMFVLDGLEEQSDNDNKGLSD